jgi:D-sedoheptulose 7-phosphate isomerase
MPSISDQLQALKKTVEASESILPDVEKAAACVVESLQKDKKILSCGNGGSATDAMHLAEECVGRYRSDRRSLPAIALNADSSVMTCIANDWSFDDVYARQIEGLGAEGDVLVAFSTSGNSPNIVRALEAANQYNLKTIALLGKSGGRARGIASIECVVPSEDTARIQEIHTWILHVILEEVEGAFAPKA